MGLSHFPPRGRSWCSPCKYRPLLSEVSWGSWWRGCAESFCSLSLTLQVIKVDLSPLCVYPPAVPVPASPWLSRLIEPHPHLYLNALLWEDWQSGPNPRLTWTRGPLLSQIISYSRITTVCRFVRTKLKINPATKLHTYFDKLNKNVFSFYFHIKAKV